MSVQGLGDISYEIGRLMEMLQQFQASQPGAGQFGKQRGGGCFGNDELAFQRVAEEIQRLMAQLQALGLDQSSNGKRHDGLNINISG